MTIDAAIIDYAASLFLRYFRNGERVNGETPRIDRHRDADVLKTHWAVSEPVLKLAKYVLAHPHEAQSLLRFQNRVDDAVVRGRIDARATWRYRLQSGLPSAIVAEEPIRSFDTGPNFVLAWVLRQAGVYAARLSSWQTSASPYAALVEQAQGYMRGVQKIEVLREPLKAVLLGQRPGAGALRAAARARQPIYRLAVDAYFLLQGLERGDTEAMHLVACSALITPLETWRRFELAVALATGEALAGACRAPLLLHLLDGESSSPILTVGRFAVYWQQRTSCYTPPPLEPSEIAAHDVLKAYGLSLGGDRPDLVVLDRETSAVASVVEVKYLSGDTANARFREAVDQVVRYARGYARADGVGQLIARSLVALSHNAPALIDTTAMVPTAIDFESIRHNGLARWADRLANQTV